MNRKITFAAALPVATLPVKALALRAIVTLRRVAAGLAAGLLLTASAQAAVVNGVFTIDSGTIIDLYSATFDGALTPCTGGEPDPAECTFFGGTPGAGREITFAVQDPAETNGTLDVQYDDVTGEITQINSLVVNLPDQVLTISNDTVVTVTQGNSLPTPNDTIFAESGTGAPNGTADPDESAGALGPSVFEHDDAPNADAPDFATFSDIVDSCTGGLCGIIGILSLDGVRYRLLGTVSAAGGDSFQLQTQTSNNSIYKVDFTTAMTVVLMPEIVVTENAGTPDDDTIPFGDVEVGMTSDETITVANTGTANLVLGNIAQANPLADPPFSIPMANDNCSGATLAPATNCTFVVRFAPDTAQAENDTFDIPSNDADEDPVTITVNGTGTAPEIDVTDSVAPFDDEDVPFGTVFIGNTPMANVTVTNTGTANLRIDGNVGQADPLAAPFGIVANNCNNQTLAPAGSCTITVQYTPANDGITSNDSFDIPSTDADEDPVVVTVSGTASAMPVAEIEVTDSIAPNNDRDLPFGDIETGMTSDETITVTNTGNADLNVTSITAPAAPFSIFNETCSGGPVAQGGGTCVITVRFAPVADGPQSSSVVINSDAGNDPIVSVNVSGEGLTPAPEINVTDSVAPTNDLSVPFGTLMAGMMSTETVTVTNDGTANLMLGTVGQVEALAPPFTVGNNTCGMTLAPMASCSFEITFAPGSVGTFNDSIDIPSDDADEASVVVAVSGTGSAVPQPDIDVGSGQVDFGDVAQDATATRSITVTNAGSADLSITSVSAPSAPFSIASDTCSGQSIAPAATCEIGVEFTPTALGNASDSIDIPSNDPDMATVTVDLTGNGIEPSVNEKLSLSPTGADGGFFGLSFDPQSLLALFLMIPMARAYRRRVGARRSIRSVTKP